MLYHQSTRAPPLAGGRGLQNHLSRTQPTASNPAQDPAIYAWSGVTAVEEAGTMYFLRECNTDKRVQTASPHDFRPDGPAFGSPLGVLSYPIDNVYHAPSNELKRVRSVMMREPQHLTGHFSQFNYQPTDPYAASPEGRWHHLPPQRSDCRRKRRLSPVPSCGRACDLCSTFAPTICTCLRGLSASTGCRPTYSKHAH